MCGGSLLRRIFSDGGDEQIFEWVGADSPYPPSRKNTVKKVPNFEEELKIKEELSDFLDLKNLIFHFV